MFGSFIRPVSKVIKKVDRFGSVLQSIESLKRHDVLIGIPQAESSREGGAITNAELAYIHSKGSPKQGIPARPFLEPSIMANKDRIAEQQAKIIKDALAGNANVMHADMEKLGIRAQNFAKGWFVNPLNEWAPNTPETIARKGSDKPLIDTGQLRNAITYVVREK